MNCRPVVALAATALLVMPLAGCATLHPSAPSCRSSTALGLVAQSVPTASLVPCVATLAQGWHATSLSVEDGRTQFDLVSDRSHAPVRVVLRAACNATGATDTTARAPGAQTLIRLRSIDPQYAGALFDVFTGGCVEYDFEFQRGPHIALMEEFEAAVGLYSRQRLTTDLDHQLGLRIDP